jgi:EPS-associated MarR family transcriptional regulator
MNDKKNKDSFDILRFISKKPDISQRRLSEILGFSLGKLNYCINELKKKGLIKIQNFKNSKKKINYLYILTPRGISKKKELTLNFMKSKIYEYDELMKEEKITIEENKILRKEIQKSKIGHNSDPFYEINENKERTKPLFKTIEVNIKRRTVIVDDILTTFKDKPIPSWIELSIIDVCNRSCSFCPKSDPKIAPDTYQRMQMNLINKLTEELKEIGYKGSVVLCGYGEPMLHKEINIICKKLSEVSFVEIVTNGDTLNPKKIRELYANNVNKLLISMYDGEHQIAKFKKMTEIAGVPDDFVILRDRWYDAKKDYGLKLTNRTGTINIGTQEEIGKYKKCFYPSYQFLIDWNGDIFLCPQDWQRRVAMGNMMQEHIFDIWTNNIMSKFRKNLIEGKRINSPCTQCNAEGTILGKNHARAWANSYSNQK